MSLAVKNQDRHLRAYFPDKQVRESIAGAFPEMDRSEHRHFNKLPVAGLLANAKLQFQKFPHDEIENLAHLAGAIRARLSGNARLGQDPARAVAPERYYRKDFC